MDEVIIFDFSVISVKVSAFCIILPFRSELKHFQIPEKGREAKRGRETRERAQASRVRASRRPHRAVSPHAPAAAVGSCSRAELN